MGFEHVERNNVEGSLVGGRKVDFRADAFIGRLHETRGAQAPAVAGLEAGEPELGPRGGKVVAQIFRVGEEFRGHHRADGVRPLVGRTGVAMAVAEKAGDGVGRTGRERAVEDVDGGSFVDHGPKLRFHGRESSHRRPPAATCLTRTCGLARAGATRQARDTPGSSGRARGCPPSDTVPGRPAAASFFYRNLSTSLRSAERLSSPGSCGSGEGSGFSDGVGFSGLAVVEDRGGLSRSATAFWNLPVSPSARAAAPSETPRSMSSSQSSSAFGKSCST